MKILIVEDDLVSRKLLQKFFVDYGTTETAIDGMEAMDAFLLSIKENDPYDLIFLDIMMPKLDGIRVLKAIRDIEAEKGIETDNRVKIIMTTALNQKEIVMQAYEHGCDAYLWKPLDFSKIKKLMVNLGDI